MPEQFTQGPSILQSDIVNNLTTDSSTKPLSAAQGKVLNDKFTFPTLGTINSLSDLETAITNTVGTDYSARRIMKMFTLGTAFGEFTATGQNYLLQIDVTQQDRWSILIEQHSNIGNVHRGVRAGSTWTWDKLALNSNMANMAHIKKSNIPGNNSVSVQILLPAFVSIGRGSASNSTTTAFIDGWASTIYLSNNSSFTISLSNNETLTITNNTGGYCNYIVIY